MSENRELANQNHSNGIHSGLMPLNPWIFLHWLDPFKPGTLKRGKSPFCVGDSEQRRGGTGGFPRGVWGHLQSLCAQEEDCQLRCWTWQESSINIVWLKGRTAYAFCRGCTGLLAPSKVGNNLRSGVCFQQIGQMSAQPQKPWPLTDKGSPVSRSSPASSCLRCLPSSHQSRPTSLPTPPGCSIRSSRFTSTVF